MEWINQLKIAVIEKNESKIDSLIQSMPQFETRKEMEDAAYLLQEAHTILSNEKDKLASNLLKIKKQKVFLNSISAQNTSFDQSL